MFVMQPRVPKGRGGSAPAELLTELQLSRTHAGHATRMQAAGSRLFAKWSVSRLSAGRASRSLPREGVWQPRWVTGLTRRLAVTYRSLLLS